VKVGVRPVAGWRDTVTQEAQDDLDGLVDAAAEFALQRIAAAGEFLPFALGVSVAGERQVLQPNYPAGNHAPVVDQLVSCWDAVCELRDGLRAAAVTVNVTLPQADGDGIDVTVEHREGVAINLVFPYRATPDGGYELEPPSASRESLRVWAE
jgi:hypothetical protein